MSPPNINSINKVKRQFGAVDSTNPGAANRCSGIQPIHAHINGHDVSGNRSLCAAPDVHQGIFLEPGSALNTEIEKRFAECLIGSGDSSKVMLSFHSVKGNRICNSYLKGAPPADGDQSRRPTVLELCLKEQQLGRAVQIEIKGVTYSIVVEPSAEPIDNSRLANSVEHIAGQYVLTARNGPNRGTSVHVPFLELAPPFDGRCISADVLLDCYGKFCNLIPNRQMDGKVPGTQFSSALGICRAPALLIMDQFINYACENSVAPRGTAAVVRQLLASARQQTGKNLMPDINQENAMIDACEQLLDRINALKAEREANVEDCPVEKTFSFTDKVTGGVEEEKEEIFSDESDFDQSSVQSVASEMSDSSSNISEVTIPRSNTWNRSTNAVLAPLGLIVSLMNRPEVGKVLDEAYCKKLTPDQLKTHAADAARELAADMNIANSEELQLLLKKTCVEGLYHVLRYFKTADKWVFQYSNKELAELATPQIKRTLLSCQMIAQFIDLIKCETENMNPQKYLRYVSAENQPKAWLALVFEDLQSLIELNNQLQERSATVDQPWLSSTSDIQSLVSRAHHIIKHFSA